MKNLVVPLRHTDVPALQTDALYSLQAALGEDQSKDVIERAVYELSDRLWMLERAMHDNELDEVKRIAKGLIGISAQIGLTEFSLVASDLVDCIQSKDDIAIASVSARLVRVGERSLFMAVQFPEVTG